MIDVSGLTEVKMKKHKGKQGRYFLDVDNQVVAKTCYKCSEILLASSFTKGNSVGKLHSNCRGCLRATESDISNRSGKELEEYRHKKYPKGLKFCNPCSSYKPLSVFSTDRKKLDGLQSRCRDCQASYSREYGIIADDHGVTNYRKTSQRHINTLKHRTPEEVLIDRRRLHPDGLKSCYRCDHSKPFSDFYTSMSEPDGLTYTCIVCQKAEKYDRNRKKLIDYWKKNSIPLVCYICDGPWEHADHVIAFSRGGSDAPDNRLPICKSCNSSKWKHPLGFWLLRSYPEKVDKIIHKVTVVYGMSI